MGEEFEVILTCDTCKKKFKVKRNPNVAWGFGVDYCQECQNKENKSKIQCYSCKREIKDGKEHLTESLELCCSKECKEFLEANKNKLMSLKCTPLGIFIRKNDGK